VSLSTPVGFFIFNRPDLTERVFAAIARARPRKLFIVADGPRSQADDESCVEVRRIATQVDWECECKTLFSSTNLGCGPRIASGIDWIFSEVEECIFLEDDTFPCPSFFSFCSAMLDRYRDDQRILHVNGDNSANENRTPDSYYFSKYAHTWGWASWRRAWRHYDYRMPDWPEFESAGLLAQVCEDADEEAYWREIFEQMHADPAVIGTWDYQWVYAVWTQSGMVVAPNRNLISNIGFGRADASHTTAEDPRANLPTSDLGELRHPHFVVRHREADRHSFDVIFGGRELREADGARSG
jgi:hypothetical protein